MSKETKPPRDWLEAAKRVVAGTDLMVKVQHSEAWTFVGDEDSGEATPLEYDEHYHVTVPVSDQEPLMGHGNTVEAAADGARSRVESWLSEKGE